MAKRFSTFSAAVLLTLFCSGAYAADEGFSRAVKNCVFEKNWDETPCTYSDLSELEKQKNGKVDEFETWFWGQFSPSLIEGFSSVSCSLTPSNACDAQREGENKLALLGVLLKKTSRLKNLPRCKQACLALCASSQYLAFQHGPISPLGDVSNTEQGTCYDYARVAENLFGKLGLEGSTVYLDNSKLGHMVVRVQLGGQWYYAEPQRSECTLYKKGT